MFKLIVPVVTVTLPVAYTAYNNKNYFKFLIGLVVFTIIGIIVILMTTSGESEDTGRGLGEFILLFLISGSGWACAVFYSWYYTFSHYILKEA